MYCTLRRNRTTKLSHIPYNENKRANFDASDALTSTYHAVKLSKTFINHNLPQLLTVKTNVCFVTLGNPPGIIPPPMHKLSDHEAGCHQISGPQQLNISGRINSLECLSPYRHNATSHLLWICWLPLVSYISKSVAHIVYWPATICN